MWPNPRGRLGWAATSRAGGRVPLKHYCIRRGDNAIQLAVMNINQEREDRRLTLCVSRNPFFHSHDRTFPPGKASSSRWAIARAASAVRLLTCSF